MRFLRAIKNMSSVRVYEYISKDGIVYWSLRQHKDKISNPKRLILQNRIGTPLSAFLVYIRALASLGVKE